MQKAQAIRHKTYMTTRLSCLTIFLLLSSFLATAQAPEFRAAWVATVSNIDWPSRSGLSTAQQQEEFINLLDMHKKNGLNAVIVQIRPVSDAFYQSTYEPWSEYLTGTQGQAPYPFYDPMKFMIEEAHKRSMEFHAWINPYRAVFNPARSSLTGNHISKMHKEWFITYPSGSGSPQKWFDPGNPDGRKFVVAVIEDIVKRYDIDGIHLDDYFYPYPVAGHPFPDDATYRKYGNGMDKQDWRRSNVDSAILGMSRAIKSQKPWVKFGVSPFGVWRNKSDDPDGSETRAGVKNYDDLYADILLWLDEGWIDYVAPQLYWEIGHRLADYTTLVDWWGDHTYGRHCYIGVGLYRATEPARPAAWRDKTMLPRMITMERENPNLQGMVFYSSKSFRNNPNGWNDSLQQNYYKTFVPTPKMEWLPAKNQFVKDTLFSQQGKALMTAELKTIKPQYEVLLVESDNKKLVNDTFFTAGAATGIDVKDFNFDGYIDVQFMAYNQPSLSKLYLYNPTTKGYDKVIDFEKYPLPIAVKGINNLFYSYLSTGCSNINWDSYLFTIKDNKAVPIAFAQSKGCDDKDPQIEVQKWDSDKPKHFATLPYHNTNTQLFLSNYWKAFQQ